MSSRAENVSKIISLSYSIDRDSDHFYPRNVSGTLANCRYMEILSSRPTEVSGVKGEGKRWSTGNRARYEDCISRVKLRGWRVTPNSRGICREARGWVGTELGAELFIELCSMVRPTRPFFFATCCSFASLFGQIRRYGREWCNDVCTKESIGKCRFFLR